MIQGRFYLGVWAVYDAGAPVTVHNYCLVDTRTVNAKEWKFDPFKVLLSRLASGGLGKRANDA